MAEVIHTIKGNEYLYEHTREGEKVVCEYIGPVGKGGKVRKAQHGGGAPLKVTQQTGIQKNQDEQKLREKGFEIITAPEWLLEDKIGGQNNKNVMHDRAAIKIVKESDKAYQVHATRIPIHELTDSQKATVMNIYYTRVAVWIPKSQVEIEE